MRKLLLMVACWSSLALPGASGSLETPDFQSLYESYAGAVREMNVDAYMGFFDENIRVAASDGQELGKPELTQAQRRLAHSIHVNSFEVSVQSVTPLATGEFEVMVLQEFDRDLRDGGVTVNLRSSAMRREVWRSTDSGWKIVQIENVLNGPTVRHVRHWL